MNAFIDQILLLDKPKNMTSYDVIRKLKPVFPRKTKIGHGGTLDPLASGLLIVGVGQGTKRLTQFLKLPKRYQVEALLGQSSLTYDAEGPFTAVSDTPVLRDVIEKIIAEKFSGEISQTPPVFSSIHVPGRQGLRAYELARKGESFQLEPRLITIQRCEIIFYEWPCLILDVRVSSGTYIRSLIHDLGLVIGCGAYAKEIRRMEIGSYSVENAQTLEQIVATHAATHAATRISEHVLTPSA